MNVRAISLALALVAATLPQRSDAQVTETVQKLLPATVAVEFKTSRAKPAATDQSSAYFLRAFSVANQQVNRPNLIATAPVDAPVDAPVETVPEAGGAGDGGANDAEGSGGDDTVTSVTYSSGTIVSPDGLIVTVLGSMDAGEVTVTLPDRRQLPARIVVADRRSRLQLLKIEGEGLPAVTLSEQRVRLGEQVATVVCTDIHDRAAATGIVTATDRSIDGTTAELMQTDVSVGPMSAGASLASYSGEVTGILIAMADDEARSVSYAVPSSYVRDLLAAYKGDGPIIVHRGFLGVQLDDDEQGHNRAVVTHVLDTSPAKTAGIEPGDVILRVADTDTATSEEVVRMIGKHKAEERVAITLSRNNEERQVEVTLAPFPEPLANRPADDNWQHALLQWHHPGGLFRVHEDGALKPLTPEDLKGTEGAIVPYLKWVEQVQEGKAVKDYRQAIEKLEKALHRQNANAQSEATIRVQRSDVEEKLGELTDRVQSLQSEVKKLTEELQKIGAKLDDE